MDQQASMSDHSNNLTRQIGNRVRIQVKEALNHFSPAEQGVLLGLLMSGEVDFRDFISRLLQTALPALRPPASD